MFSKYEVYTETYSVYYYKDTDVLKNKFGIKSAELLREAEEEISIRKQIELVFEPINGRFTVSHLLNIHKYLFGDVYSFAGHIRYEDISKGNTKFISNLYIKQNLNKIFMQLKEDNFLRELDRTIFISKLAYYMAELNVIHPFREGNGRAIREFIRELAIFNGYNLNWENVNKNELLDASIDSVYDITNLIKCLEKCL